MTDKKEKDQAELTLEARLQRLEAILGQLETGEADLEQALALFEEGVGHVRTAEGLIAKTELRVEELLASGETKPLSGDASS